MCTGSGSYSQMPEDNLVKCHDRRTRAWGLCGIIVVLAIALSQVACGRAIITDSTDHYGYLSALPHVDVEPYFRSKATEGDVDSPMLWMGNEEEPLVVVTAKAANDLVFFSAMTGELVQRRGRTGSAMGELRRPNGIAITDDIAWIVERDNRRLQLFQLPQFESLGFFGDDVLIKPYGITVQPQAYSKHSFIAYVTDDYGHSAVGKNAKGKVKIFDVVIQPDLQARLAGTIAADSADPPLGKVESIMVDPHHEKLLVADEEAKLVRVYSLDGRYLGVSLGGHVINGDAEGIALYECSDGSGYWILTDQGHIRNRFLVHSRSNLSMVGSFSVNHVSNTDGIAVTSNAIGPHGEGALFVIDDDAGLAAVSWSEIAEKLFLRRCAAPEMPR